MASQRTAEMQKAVAQGNWRAVLRLWDSYAAGILDEIRRHTCTRARMAEAREFLDWAQRFALCSRAHAQNRLARLHAAERYGMQPASPRSSLRTRL